ncbi:thiol reductant ABC exporter subunit CydD [Lacisediminihabitans profunda]|uniref:Thiol reductant ABC exporter subunit CydD n=1 Tax=Lacisediminihabitans profunda TaxID=2594790 RepID=A0A5C8ULD9_9MICO|nr:thiol reductant ABC exporter subunit CydD [Lacisediminihabitans profunda]TXN28963.1 thiol reductant ABC exporter subunit CydD [Lacisediminihabitans profunda]
MRPFDPRLLRYAAAARLFLVLSGALGVARTACTVAFCWLLSRVLVDAIHGVPLEAAWGVIGALAAVGALRAALVWLADFGSARGSALVKSQLRRRFVAGLARLGPGWLAGRNRAEIATTAGHGLEALDGYFSLFLPQLVLTAVATPVIVAVMMLQDATSGIAVLVTLPLIPLFMVLIGWATQSVQRAQWRSLTHLSSRFLDLVNGLATLKIFGRAERQRSRIEAITEGYRVETMKVLRISFLSGFALELIASLSVALVAVSVGLRLVNGDLGLGVGLFVLLLAPEAFLPLRQVGANYHAAADGIAAAEDVFVVLDAADAVPTPLTRAASNWQPGALAPAGVRFSRVTVDYEGDRAVHPFNAEIDAGRMTVLAGPSGSGKSSIIAALLGFVPFAGEIDIDGDRSAERLDRVAWAGQNAGLLEGTIAANVALGAASVDRALVERSLALAAASELDQDSPVAVNGGGLSGGQADRVAVARAIYRCLDRGCPILVLDEPTAALDGDTEADLLVGLRTLAAAGITVLVASHRPAVLAAADDVIRMAEPANA